MKIIITLCSLIISALALAADNIQPSLLTCSYNGSSVLYVNGVKTERWEAKDVTDHIKQSITSSLLDKNNSNMETVYDLSYNKTIGWGPDFLESAVQKLSYLGLPSETSYVFLYHFFTYPGKMSEALLTKILNSATIARILIPLLPTLFSETAMKEIFEDQYQQQILDSKELKKKISYSLLNNKKLILISHSQGNLFSVLALKDFINGEELSYTASDKTNVTGSYNDYGKNITHVLFHLLLNQICREIKLF